MRISLNFIIFGLLFSNLALAEVTEADICTGCENAAVESPIKKIVDKIDEKFNQMTFLDPVTVEKMDSRQLAEMIVSRLHNKCDTLKDPAKNWANPEDDDSDIMMLVPSKVVSSIQEYGFKNQHQTNSTNGDYDQAGRLSAEGVHVDIGLGYSNKTRELLPKYSLQVFKGKMRPPHDFPDWYGDVIFKFKKQIKKRTTWYQRDSLSIKNQLHTSRLKPKDGMSCEYYCEAQIWGDLDMSDVESVIVKKGAVVTDAIKQLGLPVYNYDRKKDSNLSVKIGLSEKPIYTPENLEKIDQIQKITDRSLGELKNLLKNEASGPKKQILKGHILSKMSNDQLIKSYKSLADNIGPTDVASDEWSLYAKTVFFMALKFKNDPEIDTLLKKKTKLYKLVTKETCKL